VPHLTAAGVTTAGNLLLLAWPAGEWLRHSWLAGGLPYLSAGAAVVAGGIAVSLLKMGVVADVRQWLERLNQHWLTAPDETS
jgi:apolipoprotein N-acyltransferase